MTRIGNVTGDNGLSFPSEPSKPVSSELSGKIKDLNEQHDIIPGTMGNKEFSLAGREIAHLEGKSAYLHINVAV